MVDNLRLFYHSTTGEHYKITDNVIVNNPSLREIKEFGERKYYSMVSTITANPSACKVDLWVTYSYNKLN
jgi:hypothetical protein